MHRMSNMAGNSYFCSCILACICADSYSPLMSSSASSSGLTATAFRDASSARPGAVQLTIQQQQHNASVQKYERTHRLPNAILAAATRIPGATPAQIKVLVDFGYSAKNIFNSQLNTKHSAMERLLNTGDSSCEIDGEKVFLSTALSWKGNAIWQGLIALYDLAPDCAGLVCQAMAGKPGYDTLIAEYDIRSWQKLKEFIQAARERVGNK